MHQMCISTSNARAENLEIWNNVEAEGGKPTKT
jgi:hypothetical protein